MFRNYLKTFLRFLTKNPGFSLLNLIGLSIGTLCCIYILLYVREQHSYDRYFSDARKIYRVTGRVIADSAIRLQAATPPPLGPALGEALRNDLEATRVFPTIGCDQHLLIYGGKGIYEKDAYLVDTNFFSLFDFHFVAGSADNALVAPESIVLLKSVADKLFGDENPIGKRIALQNSYGDFGCTVKGVVEESGGRSSIHAGLFIRMNRNSNLGGGFLEDKHWADHNFAYTFIKLRPDAAVEEVERKIMPFLNRQIGNTRSTHELRLQPVTAIHTTGGYDSEMSKTVSSFFLAVLIGIAAMIQLIACINFMNLSTARAARRAKEVGVRKIIGADGRGLVIQFLTESLLYSLAAVFISMPLLIISLPWLNGVTGADLPRTVFFEPGVWCLLVGLAALTGILAGSYPAFFLSAFQAPKVLKGDFSSHISAAGIRRTLVVFQFVLSIVLIVSILIMRQQMDYMQKKDLGFRKDEQLIFNFYTWSQRRCAEYFATAIRQFPDVSEASRTDNYPGAFRYRDEHVHRRGLDPATAVSVQTLSSDEHFLRTMGIRLVSGRDFHGDDTGSVIINQSLARQLKLDSAQAPGTSILGPGGSEYFIAGVMKDFNFQSLHEKVAPFMIVYKEGIMDFNHLIISVHPASYAALLNEMEVFWRRRVFVAPFDFRFLSDQVQKLYETEIIMSRIINSFTIMAVIISCLGLFGLTAFNAEQRTKEIGIRKVMGASVSRIVWLLSIDFVKLITIAFTMAVPIAWQAMTRWLEIFAYHITIPWWTFVLAGGSTLGIAIIVVLFQAVKAAVVNPAKSLREG